MSAKLPEEARLASSASDSDNNGDADVAVQLVGHHAQVIDPAVERRAMRKIDLFLMPSMFLGYCLVYYDKAILGSSALLGITTDLSLSVVVDAHTNPPTVSTSRLSWATALFYFGMLAGLYPMSLLLQRFRIGHVLGPLVIVWGIVCMLTAAVTSWQGQRFFLGFVESVVPTSFSVIIGGWYNQREQGLRQSVWYSANGFAAFAFGGITYGFATIHGAVLARWQYLYLFAGALTILFGGFCCFMPDSPVEAWFLTHEEKVAAVERLRQDQSGVRSHKIKTKHIWAAVKDVKYWLVAIMMACVYTTNGAVSGLGPLIVSTFGWTSYEALLLQFPLGGITMITVLLTGYIATKLANTILLQLALCALPTLAGFIMIWKSTWSYHAATPIVGYCMVGFFGGCASLTIIAGMSNVSSATSKSLMAASIFIGYTVGNIIGPLLVFSPSKAQHYPELWEGLVICYCILIAACAGLGVHLWLENRKRARMQLDPEKSDDMAFRDLSDRENPYFRYRF